MSKISFFQKFPSRKGEPHVCTKVVELLDFLNAIKYGEWKEQVAGVRIEKDKDKREALKWKLPTVTISGTFKERKQDALIVHSGYICVDIDGFSDVSALIADKYTFSLFRSASGNGLAVVVRVNPEKHKESYRWLSDYYFTTYGIVVDPAPKNVASCRYVSHDPDIYINEKSLKSLTKTDAPIKIRTNTTVADDDAVGRMVAECVQRRIDLAPNYQSYLQLGFALANGFQENGRAWYHQLCQVSDKYMSTQADRQYDLCLRGAGKSGITVGTFYYMLKQAGIVLPKSNERATQLAALGKKSGRTPEGVVKQLVQMEKMPADAAKKVVDEVFKRTDINLKDLTRDEDQLIPAFMDWLGVNHPMRVNEITLRIEDAGSIVTKERINSIYLDARVAFNSKNITRDLVESVIYSDKIPRYHPITEYINANKHRNSTGNIEAIAKCINTDTPGAQLWITKWIVSIIAAYNGHPVRSVLALTGVQASGKTEFFRRLLPRKLMDYYAESKLDNGKDSELLMTQKLIVMDDEMSGKSKDDEKRFKALTSAATFSLRAPYGKHNEDFKRLAILCGTSNDPAVINDPTGNTRILPVNVVSIDHEAYNAIDKDELFAEAVRMYDSGYDWKLTRDEMIDLGALTEDFESIPFERELIQKYLGPEKAIGISGFVEKMTSTEIKIYLERESQQKILNLRRFGIELSRVFGRSFSTKRDNIKVKVYKVVRLSGGTTGNDNSQVAPQNIDNDDLPF